MNADFALTIDDVFEGLGSKTLKEFEALGQRSGYPPGALLFGAGKPCWGVFGVVSGQVSVSISDRFSRHAISHVARLGELLGLKAALCGEVHAMTAQTEGPSEVIFMS